MGVPVSDVKAAETVSAESLLESFKSIDAAERRRHASVLNYWLSIRGDKDVAPIRDLDPLEISDAGPNSLLLELIGGGEDAEIKHSGDALKAHVAVDQLSQAPRPSLLACVAGKLAIVAISRNFLAFEDEFTTDNGTTRCWLTLLPFSSTGVWVDYVYVLATVADGEAVAEDAAGDAAVVEEDAAEAEAVEEAVIEEAVAEPEPVEEAVLELDDTDIPPITIEEEAEAPVDEAADAPAEEIADAVEDTPVDEVAEAIEPVAAEADETIEAETADYDPEPESAVEKRPGFSKIFEALTGFHGTNVKVDPKLPEPPSPGEEPVAEIGEEPAAELQQEPEPEPEAEIAPVAELAADPEPDIAAEPEAPVVEAPADQPIHAAEGTLQSKLEDVRAKADEARLAKLRSNAALYEGLSAAYDFALDAEHSPEEYLRLVEAQGLKIQLRSPMTPVVKLAFDGMCDDSTIGQLEAVLAWALKQDLPRGTLAEKIQSAGGIGPILNGQAAA
jgi:hypothetical protein